MPRLLAEVVEIAETGDAEPVSGLETKAVRCLVKILGAGVKGEPAPKDTKGRTGHIARTTLFDWELEKGAKILLSPEESRPFLCPLRFDDPTPKPNGESVSLVARAEAEDGGENPTVTVTGPGAILTEPLAWERSDGRARADVNVALEPADHSRVVTVEAAQGERRARAVLAHAAAGEALAYEADTNHDGFDERVFENAFLRAVVGPHVGARIWELTPKAAGLNVFAPSGLLHSAHAELGGHTDSLGAGDDPGELWRAGFECAEVSAETGARVFAEYRYTCEDAKGLTVRKRVEMDAQLPAIWQEISFHYAGKPEADAKKDADDEDKDEFELTYAPRTLFRCEVDGEARLDSSVRIEIPLHDRVERTRYYTALWHYPVSGVKLGAVAIEHESLGVALLALTDPSALASAPMSLGGGRVALAHSCWPRKLEPKRQATYGLLYAVGCSSAVTPNLVALLALGDDHDGRTPLAVIARHREAREGEVLLGETRLPLGMRRIPAVGDVLTAYGVFETGAIPEIAACRTGEETLELPTRRGGRYGA